MIRERIFTEISPLPALHVETELPALEIYQYPPHSQALGAVTLHIAPLDKLQGRDKQIISGGW